VGCQVIFAPQAVRRLQQIVSHIARENPDAALRFGMRLVDHAELLADYPNLGVPYRKRPGVRRLSCKPYFIYYRVKREQHIVEIMDYRHAARREPDLNAG
jgi:plasmid stabilization system protein ParE